jgi:hypothetical protein
MDLAHLDEAQAIELVTELLAQLAQGRIAIEDAERRVAGTRKMIEGLVEMFPAAEDLLPDDLDDDEEPRPRGTEAVRRVLADRVGDWYAVPQIVDMLNRRDWLPVSSNASNAVRTALERAVEAGVLKKSRAAAGGPVPVGTVIYSFPPPPQVDLLAGFGRADDEEPF